MRGYWFCDKCEEPVFIKAPAQTWESGILMAPCPVCKTVSARWHNHTEKKTESQRASDGFAARWFELMKKAVL